MTVYLVGAGPGDPGLLTRRGAELLGRAELVVHDRLAAPSLLDLCPAGAERVDVGKRPGGPADQAGINALLVSAGKSGRLVVRLKGGDPFVFGRGAEEALALEAAGVAYEVVPGVSSAMAAPAYAGVPVTHRGLSTSFSVVTGHSRAAIDADVNWEALASVGGTVVVLMGVAHRAEIAARLMAGGRRPATPVVAVRWGTRPDQVVTRTTLGELSEVVLEPPVTLVIGEVAAMGLGWYARSRPLLSRRVVVTRSASQASTLSSLLAGAGAEVVEVPVIAQGAPADRGAALRSAAIEVGCYDWVVFTSANAVERFMALLRDARDLGAARVAAIGPGTAGALASWRVVADLVPERSVAEGLVEAFPAPPGRGGGKVLLPRAAVAREALPEALRAMGWACDVVEAYVTVRPPVSAELLARARGADAITFTSASTVSGWLELGEETPGLVVCIGPVTAGAAVDGGLHVGAVADPHSIEGLVAATIHHLVTPPW
ncbi:MAG: uroporphyrinogen-III C-methyltransferase [Acidimicrobiales bacterium]